MKVNQTNAITRKDYDLYKIRMPFLLKKKKRDSFIAQELEKQHPCFNGRCCIDTSYGFERGRIVASIAVMDKDILSCYRSKGKANHFLLEGKGRKHYFASASEKIFNLAVFFSSMLVVFSGLFFFSLNVMENQKKNTETVIPLQEAVYYVPDTEEDSEEELEIVYEDDIVFEPVEVMEETNVIEETVPETVEENIYEKCSLFFKEVGKAGGTISALNLDGAGYIYAEIENCYPEKLLQKDKKIVCSTVSYEEKMPSFSLEYCSRNLFRENEEDESLIDFKLKYIPLIRNLLFENGAEIHSENISEGKISFAVCVEDYEMILKKLLVLMKKNRIVCSSITVSEIKGNFFCETRFSVMEKNNSSNDFIQMISDNNSLFSCRNIITEEAVIAMEEEQIILPETEKSGEKIGQILTEGRVLCFYKDGEKIRKVWE